MYLSCPCSLVSPSSKPCQAHSLIDPTAAAMGLAILLFMVFAGIEKAPYYGYNGNFPEDGPVKTYAFPLPGTTWVACMNAVLNITVRKPKSSLLLSEPC